MKGRPHFSRPYSWLRLIRRAPSDTSFVTRGRGRIRRWHFHLMAVLVPWTMLPYGSAAFAQEPLWPEDWAVVRTGDGFTEEVVSGVSGTRFSEGGGYMEMGLALLVRCVPKKEVVLGSVSVVPPQKFDFENGMVDVRFGLGPIEQYEFSHPSSERISKERIPEYQVPTMIFSSDADAERLVARLMSEDEVRFRVRVRERETFGYGRTREVRRGEIEFRAVRFDLAGFPEKMAEAGCPQ